MFDLDSGKLLIVAVLALIVIGPKELPRVLRQVGQAVGKLRRMAGEFQGQFMDAMKEADIADIRKELDDLNKSAALDVHFDPARDIQAELTSVMEPKAVESQSAIRAPTGGFALPPSVETAQLGSAAAGVAPMTEPEPIQAEAEAARATDPESTLAEVNGFAVHTTALPPAKRRILVKRRTSRLNIVQPESVAQLNGEPMRVSRRPVRAKANSSDGVRIS